MSKKKQNQEEPKKQEEVKKEVKEEIQNNKHFHMLYPCYFDKNLTLQQGRKVPKNNAVDKPTAKEIYDICVHLKLNCVLEKTKMHPKDYNNEGRVKVELKKDTGLTSKFKTSNYKQF